MEKKKSPFKESFTQGMGSEIGKRTATIIISIILVLILSFWGLFRSETSSSENQAPIKVAGKNGNTD
ncbi:MAG: hypothetical protein WA057_03255 [Candidatus Magasanikiibacteriota bacterium]